MRKIHQLLILALPLVGMLWLGACSDELKDATGTGQRHLHLPVTCPSDI